MSASAAIFIVSIIVVLFAGVSLIAAADRLAARTRLGQAVIGALFVGAVTSLSGTVTSVTAAGLGYPSLAISNAVGGIAIQTVFIVVADFFYRRGNLEHFAASETTALQGALLVIMLALPLLAPVLPAATVAGVHPLSVILLLSFGFGMRMISRAEDAPRWQPADQGRPSDDRYDDDNLESADQNALPADEDDRPIARVWLQFGLSAVAVAVCGLALARTAPTVAESLGLSETVVGGFLIAIPTSLPELVTAVAAVRRGALVLAVSDILGGNCFDVLFLAFSDIAYREGSIYHAIAPLDVGFIGLGLVLTGILLLGLLRRERTGIGGIGFEGWLILIVYAATAGFIATA